VQIFTPNNLQSNTQVPAEPAMEMVVGIDGAFVKAITSGIRQKQSLEVLTGRVETTPGGGHAFAVVRNLEDGQAKRRVQAILRHCGGGPDTKVRILSDGEDGLRGVVGWFGKRCEHRLDWFHVARRIDSIGKQLLYLPESPVYGWRLAALESWGRDGGLGDEDLSGRLGRGCLGFP
jgi:hypothetical protein